MNELALESAPELLSVSDVATLLKLQPRAVQLRMAKIAPMRRNSVRVWPLDLFPIDYQEQLKFALKRSGLWTLADVVQQATPRWTPPFKLASLPAFSQKKAFQVREVMLAYSAALEDGALEKQAVSVGRSKWLEQLGEGCNDKTIRRWAKKLASRGRMVYLPIEAFADGKSVPHKKAQLQHREKNRVPGELIREFKSLAVLPGMNCAAAFSALEEDWKLGKELPGVAPRSGPHESFPFTYRQMLRFKPSAATRKLGNEGKAAALRDALPHMTRTYAQLQACERYVMDDTRINVWAINDETGDRVDLHCYICLDSASRAVVGYVIREGRMLATDVDALLAQVLRTAGLAHPDAGYKTTFLFERGSVACTPEKQRFIESAYPQIEICRTSMNGGQNVQGDFVQANSGHWMGKGEIESFNRTLGYSLLRIPAQRGSVYQRSPQMIGTAKEPHVGSELWEDEFIIKTAKEFAFLESDGADVDPKARDAVEAAGLQLNGYHVSRFRQAFALAIEIYNSRRGHRREGFRQLATPKPNGGLRYETESSNERWTHLWHRAEQLGKAPQRIAAADVCKLLYKARKVRVRPNGVEITADGRKLRYWMPNSIAINEAGMNTDSEKEFMAIHHPDDMSEIYILREWEEDGRMRFLEKLPLYIKPGVNDPIALADGREQLRREHNSKFYELGRAGEPRQMEVAKRRLNNISKYQDRANRYVGVRGTRSGIGKEVHLSEMTQELARARPLPSLSGAPAPQPEPIEEYLTPNFGAMNHGE